MPTVQIFNENGTIEDAEIISRGAAILTNVERIDSDTPFPSFEDLDPTNPEILEPAATQRVEYDNKGQMSSITTDCGETENRREAENKPSITLEGIITESQVPAMKALKNKERLVLISDVDQGEVFVDRLTISQDTNIISVAPNGGGEEELAFSFQMQLKKP